MSYRQKPELRVAVQAAAVSIETRKGSCFCDSQKQTCCICLARQVSARTTLKALLSIARSLSLAFDLLYVESSCMSPESETEQFLPKEIVTLNQIAQ